MLALVPALALQLLVSIMRGGEAGGSLVVAWPCLPHTLAATTVSELRTPTGVMICALIQNGVARAESFLCTQTLVAPFVQLVFKVNAIA